MAIFSRKNKTKPVQVQPTKSISSTAASVAVPVKKSPFARFKSYGKHRSTENLLRNSIVLGAALTMTTIPMVGTALTKNADIIRNTPIHTASFTTSKSQNTGSVDQLYVSPDHKRALVVLSFKDASRMPIDAQSYRAFVTGNGVDAKDQQRLKSNIDGQVVSFGNTGTIGVYLTSDEPFAEQILRITLRSNSQLAEGSGVSGSTDKDLASDETFSLYDQWRIFVNPGAENVAVSEALGSGVHDMNVRDIYDSALIKTQEDEIREELGTSLTQMAISQNAISDYQRRVENSRIDGSAVKLQEQPKNIKGDELTCLKSDINNVANCDPADIRLHTEWDLPNGYNFVWQDGSVSQGYLDDIVPEGEDPVDYMSKKSTGDAEGSSDNTRMDIGDEEWTLQNGKTISSFSTGIDSVKSANANIALLTQAWQDYYIAKTAYESQQLPELLNLELSLKNASDNFSVNDSADAVKSY